MCSWLEPTGTPAPPPRWRALFQSIAAIVIGGVSVLGDRGHFLGPVAGGITLVALLSVLRAENMPEWGHIVLYGLTILAVLLAYGRERRTT